MNPQPLIDTARKMIADDKGLLAMDESIPTCDKRLAQWGIPQEWRGRPVSASKPEITSNSSSSIDSCRTRRKVRFRSSKMSSMFFSARCIAARRLAFSLARDSAQA